VFAQILDLASNRPLGHEAKQFSQTRRFLERGAGYDSLDQLPSGISPQFRTYFLHPSLIHLA